MYLRVTNLHPSRKKQGYSIRSKGKVTSTKDRTYLIVPRLDFCLPIPAYVFPGPLNHKRKKKRKIRSKSASYVCIAFCCHSSRDLCLPWRRAVVGSARGSATSFLLLGSSSHLLPKSTPRANTQLHHSTHNRREIFYKIQTS